MAASVRIEDEAFSDIRIDMLGTLAGYSKYEALGRMAWLWRFCTQRQTHIVSDAIVTACIGTNGTDYLVAAELGERTDEGVRVRGTNGRIEWLGEFRDSRVAGGRARAAKASRDASGRLSGVQHDAGDAGVSTVGQRSVPCNADYTVPASAGHAGPASPAGDQQATSRTPAEASAPIPTNKEYMSEISDPDPLGPIKAKVAKLIPAEAFACADLLRELMLRKQPTNAIRRRQWDPDSAARRDWANDFRLINERDLRSYAEITAVVRWLFAQTGDFQFVCQSPDAIREKWDRIQAQRHRGQPRTLVAKPKPSANDSDDAPHSTLFELMKEIDREKESA